MDINQALEEIDRAKSQYRDLESSLFEVKSKLHKLAGTFSYIAYFIQENKVVGRTLSMKSDGYLFYTVYEGNHGRDEREILVNRKSIFATKEEASAELIRRLEGEMAKLKGYVDDLKTGGKS